MRKLAGLLLAAVLVLAACDAESPPERTAENQGNIPADAHQNDADPRTVAIYAAVIRRLVTRDHTFGGGPSPFEHVYILDRPLPGGNWPRKDSNLSKKQFSTSVKDALEEKLTGLPPIDFISDPDTVRFGRDLLGGVKKNGVIVTVGPIVGRTHNVKVPNSIWCGGLCGQWLTYRLKVSDGKWRVTGTVGPVAIS